MTVKETVSLQKYADSAKKELEKSEKRLSKVEENFQTRMNGKTTGRIVASIMGTVCWLALFCIVFGFSYNHVNKVVNIIGFILSLVLVTFMIVDESISLSYYKKISSYLDSITQLKNRVSLSKSSINSNQNMFMKSGANGWHHSLPVGTSIPGEAASIENTINGMESLKNGFINKVKNVLFFVVAVAFTFVVSWALFKAAGSIMSGISGDYVSESTVSILCTIAMIIVLIPEIFLAKLVWSKTNCSVTNITLLIAVAGPVMFLLLITIGTLIVALAVGLFAIIKKIIIPAVIVIGVIGAFIGSVSGG